MVPAIPENCNTVNVYLIVKDAEKALAFYAKAFGGEVGVCMKMPDGTVLHGEVKIGNSTIMVTSENPQWELKSAETLGGSPASIHLYVDDADSSFAKAIAAGCTEISPVQNQFWGDRYGKVADPFGFQWGVATHIEDVSEEEMGKRARAWFAEMAEAGHEG
jgi:PhnB protein